METDPIQRRTVFESASLTIRHIVCRPRDEACGDLQAPEQDVLVLPLTGLFARHDGPRRHFIANANHAVLMRRQQPYRLSFPGAVGDTALSFAFHPPAGQGLPAAAGLADQALLPPRAMLARSLLARRLLAAPQAGSAPSPLAIEEGSMALLDAAIGASQAGERYRRRSATHQRHRRQVEAVKQALAQEPARDWNLAELARQVHASRFHLARLFRAEVGVPIHQYLLRCRLAAALPAVLQSGADLTPIALEHGFSSHSHFSSRFRSLFGMAPSRLRLAPPLINRASS